jgi:hypothetical protein
MQDTGTLRRQDTAGIVYGLLIVFLVVAIQFGHTIYESVQFCAFLVLFPFLVPGLVGNIRIVALPVLLSAIAFYFSTVVYINSPNATHNLLWSTRELVCFLCIIAARYAPLNRVPRLPKSVFWILLVLIGALTIAQWAYLQGIFSHNTLIPNQYFAVDTGTVAEDLTDLALAGGWASIYRSSAFYTEPSYLGYICLCLYLFVHRPESAKDNFIAFALLLFLCLIAKTASGFIILCLFFFCVNARSIISNRRFYPVFAILCVAVVYFGQPFISRLMASSDSESESSGYIRLVFPVKCAGAVFIHAPFGVPQAELPEFLQSNLPEEATVGNYDNGVANILIYFGVFGFIIWICMVGMMRNWALALFVILCALNNGNVFGYDKAVIMSISILVYAHNRRSVSNLASGAVPAYISA